MAWFRKRRHTDGLIFHPDQGSQYASGTLFRTSRNLEGLDEPKGRLRDNAVTETLFGSLKVERLHGMHFATRRQAKDNVIDWLQFYNHGGFTGRWDISARWPSRKKRLAEKERANRSAKGKR